MKKYFLYNILLNVALILMVLAAVAAYSAQEYPTFAITLAILVVLAWLKHRFLIPLKK